MVNDTKHTPGPWQVISGAVYTANPEFHEDSQVSIAYMDRQTSRTLPTERDANAKFIVLACNTHYELLEVCKARLHASIWALKGPETLTREDMMLAKAIAKAEPR